MSNIVLGIGASHSTLMNAPSDELPPGATEFREALLAASTKLLEDPPDAMVCIGSDHFRGVTLDLMPAFTIGVDECLGSGDSGSPEGPLPVAKDLAFHICQSVIQQQFDAAFSLQLRIDHGVSHSVQYLSPDFKIPIVPIVINVFAPPLPSLERCYEFGVALRRAVDSYEEDLRVAVAGSGGLSHRLPWPKWHSPMSEDDRFLVEAFRDGGGERWRRYQSRRREITLRGKDAPLVNAEFDQQFLANLVARRMDEVLGMSDEWIEEHAGNGAHEIRAWIAMAGAVQGRGEVLGYWPIPQWLTGMAVALLHPAA